MIYFLLHYQERGVSSYWEKKVEKNSRHKGQNKAGVMLEWGQTKKSEEHKFPQEALEAWGGHGDGNLF